MSWPEERKQHNYQPDAFADVYDGTRWQSAILHDDNIARNGQLRRNIVIEICGDGVNPFDHRNYSMWPLALAGTPTHDAACAGTAIHHSFPWQSKGRTG